MTTLELSEIAEIHSGGRLKLTGNHFVEHGVPAYGAGGLNGFLETAEYDREAVILSSIGARCGKCFYVEGKWTSLANTQVILANPELIDTRFLWYQLNDELSWPRAGSGQPFIKPSDVKKRKVFVPPLEEQRRIAAILDQADAIRAKRREQLDELTKLYDATFVSLFSSEDFEQLRIAEIAKTSSGATPSRSNDTYWGGAIPWVKSGELHNRFVLSTEEHITENALRSSSVKLLEPGTVLLAMYGATAGAVSELAINATTNQAVCAISPGERVTSIYLASALRSAIDSLLHQRAGGAQPNLSQEKVREFKIPVPPIELQREFAAKVQKIDEQRRMIEAALERDNELFASLQEKAFSGGL